MRKWAFLIAAVVVSLAAANCRQAPQEQTALESQVLPPEGRQLESPTRSPEERQVAAPTPTFTPVPSPTSSPQPTPILPKEGPTPEDSGRDLIQAKVTPPPVSAVEIDRGDTKRGEIALTFDAGAGSAPTSKILETLAKHKVAATMFLTGQWAETNPGLVKQIVADGHEVANHSYSHPAFTELTADGMREELARTETIVQAIAGRSAKPFFRPPFGNRDARVLQIVASEGYFSVYWTLDSTDWRPEATAASVRERVLRLSSAGTIVVFHLGSEVTAQALEEIIAGLRDKGFALVSLSRVLSE